MINQHVVSLELAKQLYEAGIKIESEIWWRETVKPGKGIVTRLAQSRGASGKYIANRLYPAPLFTELLEQLDEKYTGSLTCEDLAKYLIARRAGK